MASPDSESIQSLAMDCSGASTSGTQNTVERKRKHEELVDPDTGKVLPNAKRTKIEPNKSMKKNCLKFIMGCYKKFHDAHKIAEDSDHSNITIANSILNHVFATFTILRQDANGIVGNTKIKSGESKEDIVYWKGKTSRLSLESQKAIMSSVAADLGLVFKKFESDDKSNWYGTVSPYFNFFLANNLRMKELRIGHKVFPISHSAGTSTAFPVDKYGLNGTHHILLEGSTYPPEKRSSMAQSLGPLTVLLLHIRTDAKYRAKWTNACKRAMKHIPMIDEILTAVAGKSCAELSTIVSLLGDLLCMVSSRQASRMCFPINMMYKVYMHFYNMGQVNEVDQGELFLEHFNVSGKGGFMTYKIAQGMRWTIAGRFTASEASQAMFHSIFGTYKEDLGILQAITEDVRNWYRREDLGEHFKKIDSDGTHSEVKFTLPKLNLYAKLASSNQTGSFTSVYTQTCSLPVFSGYCTRPFHDDFFESLKSKTAEKSSLRGISELAGNVAELITVASKSIIENGKKQDTGTVSWRYMKDLTLEQDGSECTSRIMGTGRFFLGEAPKSSEAGNM